MTKGSIKVQVFVTLVAKRNMFCRSVRNNRGVAVKTRKYTKMKNPGVVSMDWKKGHNVSSLFIHRYTEIDSLITV